MITERITPKYLFITVASLWYIITAFYSNGYIHFDEHYQIIEFARYILGDISSEHLAWEFNSQIRPSTQPYIGALILSIFKTCSISSIYHQMIGLRIISGFIAVLSIHLFIKTSSRYYHIKYNYILYFLQFSIWFLPFINVRFSSESWSGIFLLLSTTLALKHSTSKNLFISGLLAGISFLFRFQIAFSLIGIILWLLLIKKPGLKLIPFYILGGLLSLLFGALLDSYFYGNLTFTPWNYFNFNILKGVASTFGTEPWYWYFRMMNNKMTVIFSIPLLCSFVYLLIKKPQSPILWIVIPFVLGHSLVSHKEFRFLYPIANFLPIFFLEGIIYCDELIKNRIIRLSLISFFMMLNLIFLFKVSTTPAGNGSVEMSRFLSLRHSTKPPLYIYQENNALSPLPPLSYVYYDKNIPYIELRKVSEHRLENKTIYFSCHSTDLKKENTQQFINQNQLTLIHSFVPLEDLKIKIFPNQRPYRKYLLYSSLQR